jgi:hypothetical protein
MQSGFRFHKFFDRNFSVNRKLTKSVGKEVTHAGLIQLINQSKKTVKQINSTYFQLSQPVKETMGYYQIT